MSGPWENSDVPRGRAYDRRFEDLEAAGMDMHGEAALVASFAPEPASVLDAGCGTGRVAIELNRRGHAVVGVDVDEAMLEAARAKAPDLVWVHGDLADPGLDLGGQTFDIVVMAGNVLIFVPPGSEGRVLQNAARWLRPGGLLVTGYTARPDGFGPAQHDTMAAHSGLVLQDRWSTWEQHPYTPGDRYAVAVHRREI
jgi:SAM-dependent methyltransferase